MFCSKCGKYISDEAEFCSFCGKRVDNQHEIGGRQVVAPKQVINPTQKESNPGRIIVECNPHWTMAYKTIIIGLIFLALGFANPLFWLISLGVFVYYFIVMKSVKLCLTADSVVGKKGIINTQRMTSPIRNVQDLSVSDGLWGKVLGYGNITISTAGTSGAEYVFKRMTRCKKFQQEFIRLQGELYRR